MIGIPFKMICNCNNNGGSSNQILLQSRNFLLILGLLLCFHLKHLLELLHIHKY